MQSIIDICTRFCVTLRRIYNYTGDLCFDKLGVEKIAFTINGEWHIISIEKKKDNIIKDGTPRRLIFFYDGEWHSVFDMPDTDKRKLRFNNK